MEMHSFRVEMESSVEPTFLGKRILIAEDETLIALDLEDILCRMGFDVVGSARNVPAALDSIKSLALDAAVLDYRLGQDTIHPVAEALRLAAVPFALATGLEPETTYVGAPMLRKPYSFDEIKTCMMSLLGTQCLAKV